MDYEMVPLVIGLAIFLFVGLILVADAVRRAVSEGREKNHDLHV
jgi:hypothetical protein